MKQVLAGAALIMAIAFPQALLAQEQYLDDRSDAGSLVRSFYNAVNRKEYARAWAYFGDQKPSASFEKFMQGYADTERVDVATGGISQEGAAGSTFYQVAVAIKAVNKSGDENVFAGCYTARLVNPQIQDATFNPLHLEKGTLKPNSEDGPFSDHVPTSCPDAPPFPATDAMKDRVVAAFKATYASMCDTLAPDAEPGAADPEIHTLKYRYTYDQNGDERQSRLFKFNCGMGAYNSFEVYYLADDIDYFRQLEFAQPEMDIRFQDPDQRTKLESMTIIGYTAADQLVNSEFDENEKSLTSFNKWRGIGDISSTGKWIFRNGDFTLVRYDVDPTEDGEINPQTVLDFDTGP